MWQVISVRFCVSRATYHAERKVVVAVDRAGNRIEKGRPAAATVKLRRTLVQRRVAPGTRVHARLVVLVKLASTGHLGAFLAEHTELRESHDHLPARGSAPRATLGRTWSTSMRGDA